MRLLVFQFDQFLLLGSAIPQDYGKFAAESKLKPTCDSPEFPNLLKHKVLDPKKPRSDAKPRRAPNLIQVDGNRFGGASSHRRLG
jgi:hypothetical protein